MSPAPQRRASREEVAAEIVRLHDGEGLSFAQIGRRLGHGTLLVNKLYREATSTGPRPTPTYYYPRPGR